MAVKAVRRKKIGAVTAKVAVSPAPKLSKLDQLVLDLTNLCIFDLYTPEIAISFFPKNKVFSGRVLRHSMIGKTDTVARAYGLSATSVLTKLSKIIEGKKV